MVVCGVICSRGKICFLWFVKKEKGRRCKAHSWLSQTKKRVRVVQTPPSSNIGQDAAAPANEVRGPAA